MITRDESKLDIGIGYDLHSATLTSISRRRGIPGNICALFELIGERLLVEEDVGVTVLFVESILCVAVHHEGTEKQAREHELTHLLHATDYSRQIAVARQKYEGSVGPLRRVVGRVAVMHRILVGWGRL